MNSWISVSTTDILDVCAVFQELVVVTLDSFGNNTERINVMMKSQILHNSYTSSAQLASITKSQTLCQNPLLGGHQMTGKKEEEEEGDYCY